MTGDQYVELGTLMASRLGSVDPSRFADETFELFSIPAYDQRRPESVLGAEIGSTKQAVQPRDVLLSKIVPHIRRAWIVGPSWGGRQIASGEWIVFRSEKAAPEYLRHALVSDDFHVQFMQTVSGVGGSLLRARPSQVAKIRIPLPALSEQRRIAAILDKADAIRANRRAALAQVHQLSLSIFVDMFGEVTPRLSNWPISSLGAACVKITDGTHHSPATLEAGVPYITAKHLKPSGLDFFSDPWFVSEDAHAGIWSRCDPKPRDVLYIKDGATSGLAAINEYEFPFSMLSSLALLRPDRSLLSETYLCHWLNHAKVKREILGSMAGAAIRRLTLSKIKSVSIPLPPISLQQEFSRRMAKLIQVRKLILEELHSAEKLSSSLQHRFFQGELDLKPNDVVGGPPKVLQLRSQEAANADAIQGSH